MPSLPQPCAVRVNDWKSLPVTPREQFVPEHPVSVVVTYYEAPRALELTLAAIECQTYPRELFEVVIVDDGSRTPLEAPTDSPLDVRVVHQQDRGFGLARARNTGVRAAEHDIIVFLDCDMMPESRWLAEHARWHHAASDVLTLGFRAHVDVSGIDADAVRKRPGALRDLFDGRPVQRPEWIEGHMVRTRELTSDDDDIFRVVTGGNLGVSRQFFELAGAYDESFTQWGAEDTEFGYRAYTRGALLLPARQALCWHQGVGAAPSASESASLELQRAKISHLIAHKGFRRAVGGRSFKVAQFAITIRGGQSDADELLATVEQILANDVHDLVIWIEDTPAHASSPTVEHERLRRLLDGDPRVRFGSPGGALDAFPAASFHISLPSGVTVDKNAIGCLRAELGGSAAATTGLGDEDAVTIARAWMLHRAARSNTDLELFGDVKQLERDRIGIHARRRDRIPAPLDVARRRTSRIAARSLRAVGHALRRNLRRSLDISRAISREASRVRSAEDARHFANWAATSVTVIAQRRVGLFSVRRGESMRARYRLGPELASQGPLATAVFAASTQVGSVAGPNIRVVIADTPGHAEDLGVEKVVALSELAPMASVPAFNIEKVNPKDWPPSYRSKPVMLRPSPGVLPRMTHLRRLRRAHHVTDTAAGHADTVTRAATLAAIAATGAVVSIAEDDPELRESLGQDLYELMTCDRVRSADRHEREKLSVAMRRCALRDHSLRARARQLLLQAGVEGPPLPLVSVLLATRRPELLAQAVRAVVSQKYPKIELVLAPHGDGFDSRAITDLLQSVGHPARVVPVPDSEPLGAVLNAAVAASSGDLITKFDDDDFYGAEHLWDLVLAHEYSKAALVGKGSEFVYLARSDRTLHRFSGRGERSASRTSMAGGAMLIGRHDLDAIMGWRCIPSGVDRALAEDVVASGRKVYRTHGMGYLLVRHTEGHTWQADDSYFLKQADEVRDGCDLAFAGIDV